MMPVRFTRRTRAPPRRRITINRSGNTCRLADARGHICGRASRNGPSATGQSIRGHRSVARESRCGLTHRPRCTTRGMATPTTTHASSDPTGSTRDLIAVAGESHLRDARVRHARRLSPTPVEGAGWVEGGMCRSAARRRQPALRCGRRFAGARGCKAVASRGSRRPPAAETAGAHGGVLALPAVHQ
jgi:hypothetical protein